MTRIRSNNAIDAEEVRRLFDYEPETGVLRWKVSPARNVFAGVAAGSLGILGYRSVTVRQTPYQAHRLIWLHVHGRWPAEQIDHIDGNKSNNRIANLREATRVENRRNMPIPKNNSLGVSAGVYVDRNRFRAYIETDGRRIHLGCFSELAEAVAARRSAELRYFGEFAPKDCRRVALGDSGEGAQW